MSITLENSPVLLLQNNILWQFENLSAFARQQIKQDVAAGRMSGEIWLDVSAQPPLAPVVKTDGKSAPYVSLHVAYLELLWAFIYSWMVMYEEGVQKPQLQRISLPEEGPEHRLLLRAEQLLAWGQSLSKSYSAWPLNLPSPKDWDSILEQRYVGKANLVFQKAAAFALAHERAHLTYKHLDVIVATPRSSEIRLQLEKEADISAFESIVEQASADNEKSAEAWAILSAILSSFYVYPNPVAALRQQSHLPLHHRVINAVRALDFQSEQYHYYFRFLCRLVLQHVFPDVLNPQYRFKDATEALEDALDRLDQDRSPE